MLGCARDAVERSASSSESRLLPAWVFATTDGKPFSSEDAKGRSTVILFFTTYDTASQIAVGRLNSEIHTLKRRINALGVALEPPNHAVLVGVFHDSLHLAYPLLLPDPATFAGHGPFGTVDVVPTWVVLDSLGREIWRGSGVSAMTELHQVLVGLGATAEQ